MSTRTPAQGVPARLDRSANDRFKARWRVRLSWSTMAAAGLHALLLFGSPVWERGEPASSRSFERTFMEGVALAEEESPPGGRGPAAIAAIEEVEPAVEEEGADGDDGEDEDEGVDEAEARGGEEGGAGGSESLRSRLRDRASFAPTVVEAPPEAEEEEEDEPELAAEGTDDSPGEDEDGDTRIDAPHEMPDFEELTDRDVGLDRLSSVRPQLAFLSPSSWILIQNPSEVVQFLEERFRGPHLEAEGDGSVSVALWIDERGSVEWAEINRSSGDPDLDDSALRLFNEVVSFRPAREQGVRVPMAVIFSVPYPW